MLTFFIAYISGMIVTFFFMLYISWKPRKILQQIYSAAGWAVFSWITLLLFFIDWMLTNISGHHH